MLDDRVTGIFDRTGTCEPEHARARAASGATAHAAVFGIELGELLALFAADRPSRAPLFGLLLPQLEAGQTVVDVRPPRTEIGRPAHRFAELTVVDDVDAGLCLLADDVRNR